MLPTSGHTCTFGLSAEIERTLISKRIKEALARKNAGGVKLGRPIESKKKKPLLSEHADFIKSQTRTSYRSHTKALRRNSLDKAFLGFPRKPIFSDLDFLI